MPHVLQDRLPFRILNMHAVQILAMIVRCAGTDADRMFVLCGETAGKEQWKNQEEQPCRFHSETISISDIDEAAPHRFFRSLISGR
jgi:hypothetical protein